MKELLQLSIVSLALASIFVTTTGCESIPIIGDSNNSNEPDPELTAVVDIVDPDFGETIPVTVVMTGREYRDSVGKLRTKKWGEAITLLTERIEKEGSREQLAEAHFARGIAYEVENNYKAALGDYEGALERVNRAEYQVAIDRLKTKLGT